MSSRREARRVAPVEPGNLGGGLAAGLTGAACGIAYAAGVLCRGTLARDDDPLHARDRHVGQAARVLSGLALAGLLGPGRARQVVLAAAVRAGVALGRSVWSDPSVQASLRAAGRAASGREPARRTGGGAGEVAARRVAAYLAGRGVRPMRLAVDGLPGSGKTTLARALAGALGLRHESLDHRDLSREIDLSAPDTVVEHHRLLRTQDVDRFGALVYLDVPVAEVRRRLLRRERGAAMPAVFDFDLMKRVGDLAFRLCAGESADLGGGVLVKLRPAGGYRLLERLQAYAARRGVTAAEATQEELLFLVATGRARGGLRAYVDYVAMCERLWLAVVAAAGVVV